MALKGDYNNEHIRNVPLKKLVYSFEVFPPKKTTSIDTIYHTLKGLPSLNPDFISVTYGAGGSAVQKNKTSEIASLIKSEYKIEPVSHLTCVGCEQEDIRAFLDHLKASGVENILAFAVMRLPGWQQVKASRHACDLMQYIREYDPSINILGAYYPEGHRDAPDLNTDIQYLKYKLEAGATHLISQLFFPQTNTTMTLSTVLTRRASASPFPLGSCLL